MRWKDVEICSAWLISVYPQVADPKNHPHFRIRISLCHYTCINTDKGSINGRIIGLFISPAAVPCGQQQINSHDKVVRILQSILVLPHPVRILICQIILFFFIIIFLYICQQNTSFHWNHRKHTWQNPLVVPYPPAQETPAGRPGQCFLQTFGSMTDTSTTIGSSTGLPSVSIFPIQP